MYVKVTSLYRLNDTFLLLFRCIMMSIITKTIMLGKHPLVVLAIRLNPTLLFGLLITEPLCHGLGCLSVVYLLGL